MKRAFDILSAVVALAVLAIPFALLCTAVVITSPGPAIHWSQRVGRDNCLFMMPKLRTMRSDAPQVATHLLHDPQLWLTPLGGFLRRSSLDELPQLFDVLAGRMSLVGPRPAGLDELAQYEDRHRLRLTVRPGVTGLWQVRRRLDNSFEQRMDDDLEYIQRWSILLDLWIVLRTVRVVLAGRGV